MKVTVTAPASVRLLEKMIMQFDGAAVDPLLNTTYAKFARFLKKLAQHLNLEEAGFSSHSLRRGGASTLLNEGWKFEDICLMGRWASARSAKLYIRQGELFMTKLRAQISEADWRRILQLSRCLPRVV